MGRGVITHRRHSRGHLRGAPSGFDFADDLGFGAVGWAWLGPQTCQPIQA